MHSWNLEKIYSKQVTKSAPVPPLNRLRVLGESVSLYRKKGEDYELIGDVDDDYYDSTLSRYIKLGSADSVELRKQIKSILKDIGGFQNDNLDVYQNYVSEGGFNIDDTNRQAGQQFLLQCIAEDRFISIGDFLKKIYGDVNASNEYFTKAWSAAPKGGVMSRTGSGELFFAFFCDGSKPDKGDLRVGNKDIEIKGFKGRLLKSDALPPLDQVLQDLKDKPVVYEDQLLDQMIETINDLSGTTKYKNQIRDFINLENIRERIIKEYRIFVSKKIGRAERSEFDRSYTMLIASAAHLLGYKENQKFDSIIAFNTTSGFADNSELQFINLDNVETLVDMIDKLNNINKSLPSPIIIKYNPDGNGFNMLLGKSKTPVGDSGVLQSATDAKTLRASARKADVKDIGVGSLLDTQ